jgi:hypothetical protein
LPTHACILVDGVPFDPNLRINRVRRELRRTVAVENVNSPRRSASGAGERGLDLIGRLTGH